MVELGKSFWPTFEQGIQKEWLLTNGIGGYASTTVIGANTRRYHGLLIASFNPPVERNLILSKLDESITIGDETHNLYTNQSPGYISGGFSYLQRFIFDIVPTYIYQVQDVFIEKKIFMVQGKNTVVVLYKIHNGIDKATVKITPIVNYRDHHFDSSREYMKFDKNVNGSEVVIDPYQTGRFIKIKSSEGRFVGVDDAWFLGMEYAMEKERGLKSIEDHFIPGYFEIDINPNEVKTITVVASMDNIESMDGEKLLKGVIKRKTQIVTQAGYVDDFLNDLVLAADDFIVDRKSTKSKTIIAGYPWFTDWGRDTMIALPGITLSTKRFDDARDILLTFSKYVKDGLIPNCFTDCGEEPMYNTVDAPLWYFQAIKKYLDYTNDYEFILENLYFTMKEIIEKYVEGTHFSIKMDYDGLIRAGEPGVQLTWMDAKINDWVVTPREGKAVEINALWYNALKIMEHLSSHFGFNPKMYEEASQVVKKSFNEVFWNSEKNCLYDVVRDGIVDDKIRPNQIFSLSLAYPVLDEDKEKAVVRTVWKQLYTAYGLRSLSQKDPQYRGAYIGNGYWRDSAYHQGTVWAWLIGHFITAYRRSEKYSDHSREISKMMLDNFKDHLKDRCLDSISEIFDGDEPSLPRGAFAQAWSVAEVLRAYVEEVLG